MTAIKIRGYRGKISLNHSFSSILKRNTYLMNNR